MSAARLGFTYAAALVLVACLVAMLVGGRGQAEDAPAATTRIAAG